MRGSKKFQRKAAEGRKASASGGGMATPFARHGGRLCVAMFLRTSGRMATQQRVAMPPETERLPAAAFLD